VRQAVHTRRRADRAGRAVEALTEAVIETALDEEMPEHFCYDKHDPVRRNRRRAAGEFRLSNRTTTAPVLTLIASRHTRPRIAALSDEQWRG
jgi:transposase-like protein